MNPDDLADFLKRVKNPTKSWSDSERTTFHNKLSSFKVDHCQQIQLGDVRLSWDGRTKELSILAGNAQTFASKLHPGLVNDMVYWLAEHTGIRFENKRDVADQYQMDLPVTQVREMQIEIDRLQAQLGLDNDLKTLDAPISKASSDSW